MLHLIWSSNASQSLNSSKTSTKTKRLIPSLRWQQKRLNTRKLLKRQMQKSKKRPNLWKHQRPSISILYCLRQTWTRTSTSIINKVSQMKRKKHTKKKTSANTWVKMNYCKLTTWKAKVIEVRSTFKKVWPDRSKLMTSIKLDKLRKINLIWKRPRLKVTTSKWNSNIDKRLCSNQERIQDKNSYQLTMSHLKKLKNRENNWSNKKQKLKNKKHWKRNVHTWPSKRR